MVEKKAIRPLDRAEPQPFRICIYKDVSIADERVRDIVAAMRDEFAPFGIRIDVPWVRDWRRPSFFMKGILQDIGNRPLESPCDRIFGIVGRDMKDFVWGIFMPEVLGVVDTKTLAKGYSVGEWGSLNHALTFRNPEELAVHEVYHLLGCAHGLSTQPCGDQIDEIVERARENRQRGEDFFPSRGLDGRYFRTRSEVDSYLGLKVVAEPERVSLSPRDEERSLR
jgi:hypothetical protein